MTKYNKIGFNNFKSFGEKVQTFSHKPLTIIYGPNSIGKSSVLHFLLYMEYIKESGELDLDRSNFAGDPLDLGGFTNFIHKKDNSKKITYQLTFVRPEDIGNFFSPLYIYAKKFEANGVFINEINFADIRERLSLYRKKDKDRPLYFLSTFTELRWVVNNPFTSRKNKEKFQKELDSMDCDESHTIDQYIERADNLSFDSLDEFILNVIDYWKINVFSGKENLDEMTSDIIRKWEIYHHVCKIKKVTIEYKFSLNQKKTYTCNYSIDNELIYTSVAPGPRLNIAGNRFSCH